MVNIRTFFTVFITVFLALSHAGCNSRSEKIENKNQNLVRAKELSAQILQYIELRESGALTKDSLTKLAGPLQARLDSVTQLLTTAEADSLKSYRAAILNEMLDRLHNPKDPVEIKQPASTAANGHQRAVDIKNKRTEESQAPDNHDATRNSATVRK